MEGYLEALWAETNEQWSFYVAGMLLLAYVLANALAPAVRTRLRVLISLLGTHVVLMLVSAGLRWHEHPALRDVRLASLWVGAACFIGALVMVSFSVLLPRLRIQAPALLQDLVFMIAAGASFFAIASRLGLNLSGLIATSAVLTAVIGLSLQDTLGNIIGGLAVQVDRAIRVGDWIKFGDVNGRVVEIRWRYTSIETRNWETIIVPNKALLQGNVTVVGRRTGQPLQWRRWVWFNIDYRYSPSDIVRIVTTGLQASPIDNVAADPAPHAIMMDFAESYGRYAVRYWLTDIARDDPTDSQVRARIYFALKRAGIRMSIPAKTIFINDDKEFQADKSREREKARREILRELALFEGLSEDEQELVAAALQRVPYHAGEVVTRQGNTGHYLYVLDEGEVCVTVEHEGIRHEVARLKGPNYFGEMSLMTGEPRRATVTALTDIECYRLTKATLEALLHERPGLAEQLATTLMVRRAELDAAIHDLDQRDQALRMEATRWELVGQIRRFFGLENPNRED